MTRCMTRCCSQEVIASSKSAFPRQEPPHKGQGPTRLQVAHLLHPEQYTPSVPSAMSTYVHGDGFSPRSPRQAKGKRVGHDSEKDVPVSAYATIRHISLHRQHEHLEKVDRVRPSILELSTASGPVRPSGSEALPSATVCDLRAVLPLVRVYGEALLQEHDTKAPRRSSTVQSQGSTCRSQTEALEGFPPYLPSSPAHSGSTQPTMSALHSPKKLLHQSQDSLSPRRPSSTSVPSPRRPSTRSVTSTTSSSSPSKPATCIPALPPPTTARDVFSGAAGGGYQVKLQAPYRPHDSLLRQTPSRASSFSLSNTIPASHHILREYMTYLHAESAGPPIRIPERSKEPTRPNHKVSLNLPKVKFVPPSAPGSAQAGMWTMPSPVASTPSSRCGRGSAPASPFLENVATRRNEYDDLYETERMKLKAEPLLLTTPISGVSNSILSVRRATASDEGVSSAAVERGTSAEGVVMGPLVPRPPPVV